MKKNAASLNDMRLVIDKIDSRILELLSERMEIVRMIGVFKLDHKLQILDTERRVIVRSNWLKNASTLHLSTDFVCSVYKQIHDYSLEIEADQESAIK